MARQQQPQQSLFESFSQNFQTAQWLMQFPAITVMVWLRRDLGFRMVSPIRIFPVTAILFVISILAGNGDRDQTLWGLLTFAVLTLALGTYQCVKRWIELGRRVRQHSYYLGTSPFRKFHWIPESIRRERRLERFADPIFCVLVGLAIFRFSHAFGAWLVFSGCCLRTYEFSVHMRDRNLSLDILDGMLRSEQQNQTVEEFEAKSAWHKHEAPNGLPTGLGEDIESQITISVKQRKTKTNNQAIDV